MSKSLDTKVKDALKKHKPDSSRLELPGKNGKYKPTKDQERAVLEFALLNNCVVNPQGWHSALEAYNEYGHCVCDPARPTCPCAEAPQEIKEKGHCKCCLFWRDYMMYAEAKNLVPRREDGRK